MTYGSKCDKQYVEKLEKQWYIEGERKACGWLVAREEIVQRGIDAGVTSGEENVRTYGRNGMGQREGWSEGAPRPEGGRLVLGQNSKLYSAGDVVSRLYLRSSALEGDIGRDTQERRA